MNEIKHMTIDERMRDVYEFLNNQGSAVSIPRIYEHITCAMEQARREENEACAILAESEIGCCASKSCKDKRDKNAKMIRSRITPPKPVWCEHVKRSEAGAYWVIKCFWNAQNKDYWSARADDFVFCPICGVKRPEGA